MKALWDPTQRCIPSKAERKRVGLCDSFSTGAKYKEKEYVLVRSFLFADDRNSTQTGFHSKWEIVSLFQLGMCSGQQQICN